MGFKLLLVLTIVLCGSRYETLGLLISLLLILGFFTYASYAQPFLKLELDFTETVSRFTMVVSAFSLLMASVALLSSSSWYPASTACGASSTLAKI